MCNWNRKLRNKQETWALPGCEWVAHVDLSAFSRLLSWAWPFWVAWREHRAIPFPNIPNTTTLFSPFWPIWKLCIVAIPRCSVFIFFSLFHFFKSFLWMAFRFRQIPHFCKISPSLHIHQFHDLSSRTPRICTNSVISRQLNTEVALLDWDVAGKDALCMCPTV